MDHLKCDEPWIIEIIERDYQRLQKYPNESNYDYFRGLLAGLLLSKSISEGTDYNYYRGAWEIRYPGESYTEFMQREIKDYKPRTYGK
jgi:hypothetical protein